MELYENTKTVNSNEMYIVANTNAYINVPVNSENKTDKRMYENQEIVNNASNVEVYAIVDKGARRQMDKIDENLAEEQTIMYENHDLYSKSKTKEGSASISDETAMFENDLYVRKK